MPTDHDLALGAVIICIVLFIIVLTTIALYERKLRQVRDSQPETYIQLSRQAIDAERRAADAIDRMTHFEAEAAQAKRDADARVNEADLAAYGQIERIKAEFAEQRQADRNFSVKQSKAVLSGKIMQEIAPLLDSFPYSFHDARHVGSSPVDYLVFDGLNDPSTDVNVVFLEVKTGSATLNGTEKRVKDAIDARRVRYEVMRVKMPVLEEPVS